MTSHRSNGEDVTPLLLYAALPERSYLCCKLVYVIPPEVQKNTTRSEFQWLTLKCRMLIFGEPKLLCSLAVNLHSRLYVVAPNEFHTSGRLDALLWRYKIAKTEVCSIPLTDTILQSALNYSMIARLAPTWNKLGPNLLVRGRNFLFETGPLTAVKLNIVVQGDQVTLNVWPLSIRLPHLQLDQLATSRDEVQLFMNNMMAVLELQTLGCDWVYALPSLKICQVISMSHAIPQSCPFPNYNELRRHWKNTYGYRLPEEVPGANCSPAGPFVLVSFKKRFEENNSHKTYLYPALCLRSQQPIFLNNVDQPTVVKCFAVELVKAFPQVCGFSFCVNQELSVATPTLSTALHKSWKSKEKPPNVKVVTMDMVPRGWVPVLLPPRPVVDSMNDSVDSTKITPLRPVAIKPNVDKKLIYMSNFQAQLTKSTLPLDLLLGTEARGFPVQPTQSATQPISTTVQSTVELAQRANKTNVPAAVKTAEIKYSKAPEPKMQNQNSLTELKEITSTPTRPTQSAQTLRSPRTWRLHVTKGSLPPIQVENKQCIPAKFMPKESAQIMAEVNELAKTSELHKATRLMLLRWLNQHNLRCTTNETKKSLIAKVHRHYKPPLSQSN